MEARCRFCGTPLSDKMVDLGKTPMANSYVRREKANAGESFFPLCAYVCHECLLVQLEEFNTSEEMFSEYLYRSSFSDSWLKHAKDYTVAMTSRFGITKASQVIEVASNDGYLLQFFSENGIPVLGIEPAANVAKIANDAGIPTEVSFWGVETAQELKQRGIQADLLLGNNVLAHVPDINGFVRAMKIALKPHGVLTMEFPHLMNLVELCQFDTIYHEHYSYLSFGTAERIFAAHGITVFDVEELPTHGGSLRIYGKHQEDTTKAVCDRVARLRAKEVSAGYADLAVYHRFAERAVTLKRDILEFLIRVKREGKSIVGYGAPAKATTLLNYCGVRTDFIDYTVDRSPYKQGCFVPGVQIPIHSPDRIKETKPDYLLILPWNLKHEIIDQMAEIRSWGGQFITLIPEVTIHP
jgi:hypothetical protein